MCGEENRGLSVLAIGAEGTCSEVGAIQQNLPQIISGNFVCSDGEGKIERNRSAGPVVIATSNQMPYARGSFDKIIARSVPVCRGISSCQSDDSGNCHEPPNNYLGPVFCVVKLMSLVKDKGKLDVGSECWVVPSSNNKVRSVEISL